MKENRFENIQRSCWRYLWDKADEHTGLVTDHANDGETGVPASIAVTGMALTALPVAVEHGWISRSEAAKRARITLRFFAHGAKHFHGFYFHFLGAKTGERVWNCEVSSIDTALLLLGALYAAAFFDGKSAIETEIRDLTEELLGRTDWNWFRRGNEAVSIAYKPESGFSKYSWSGYNEGLLLYVLGLGSPCALPINSYDAWLSSYQEKKLYGFNFLYCGPLFPHIFPHQWLDLRGQRDSWMRERGYDYFENTRRAIGVQSDWAKRRCDEREWGVSASDGPQGGTMGGYRGRGIPFGRFDGVFSPPVCLASLAFEPDVALAAWENWIELSPGIVGQHGVRSAFKPSTDWLGHFAGLDQGMLVIMLENWRSGLLWQLEKEIKPLQLGKQRAGFTAVASQKRD